MISEILVYKKRDYMYIVIYIQRLVQSHSPDLGLLRFEKCWFLLHYLCQIWRGGWQVKNLVQKHAHRLLVVDSNYILD